MIVKDTETTGFIKNMSLPLDQQPEILELGAVKLDDSTLEEVGTLSLLIRPKLMWPIPAEVTKHHGITTAMLEKAPTFARALPQIISFWLGERQTVAHNAAFDFGMFTIELSRLDLITKFPWSPVQTDSTTLASDIAGATHTGRHKLGALYEHFYGEAPAVAHRALDDARTLADILRALRKLDGRI